MESGFSRLDLGNLEEEGIAFLMSAKHLIFRVNVQFCTRDINYANLNHFYDFYINFIIFYIYLILNGSTSPLTPNFISHVQILVLSIC